MPGFSSGGGGSGTPGAAGANGTTLVAHTETSGTTTSNSTSEATLLSLTLPGGNAAAGNVYDYEIVGVATNNSAGSINYTFRFKIGATTVFASPAIGLGQAAQSRPFVLRARIHMVGTASERVQGYLTIGGTLSGGLQQVISSAGWVGYATATENSASDLAIVTTAQMATADASANFVAHAATLTKLA